MAHSNRKRLRDARGGKTRHQLAKSGTSRYHSTFDAAARIKELENWSESLRLRKNEVMTKKKVRKINMTKRAQIRRLRLVKRLEVDKKKNGELINLLKQRINFAVN